jgi:hypothetical protein
MNRIHHIRLIRRLAAGLAGLAGTLLAFGAAAPAALAVPPPARPAGHGGAPSSPVVIHTVITGGMPGWQITLIAVGAALLAATVAVLADRAWAARRRGAMGTA